MTLRAGMAIASRVLRQVRHDPRTIGLLLVVPCVLLGVLAWIFNQTAVFDHIGAPLLGVFPFVVMFLLTSVATPPRAPVRHFGAAADATAQQG
jgi:ABC-2 type transport system permease protein